MKFATRTPQDTTPDALAARLYDVRVPGEDRVDPDRLAEALKRLRGANPETIGAEIKSIVGSLILVPPGIDPEPSSQVRSITRVARGTIEALDGALARADQLLADFKHEADSRASDAIALWTASSIDDPRIIEHVVRRAEVLQTEARQQYDGQEPPAPAAPAKRKVTAEEVRAAMLDRFRDRRFFESEIGEGLEYLELDPPTAAFVGQFFASRNLIEEPRPIPSLVFSRDAVPFPGIPNNPFVLDRLLERHTLALLTLTPQSVADRLAEMLIVRISIDDQNRLDATFFDRGSPALAVAPARGFKPVRPHLDRLRDDLAVILDALD